MIIEAKLDNALRDLSQVHERLSSDASRRNLMNVVGIAAEQQFRAWFFKRDTENPNKLGWPRQHFWARIAKRTAFDPSRTTPTSATVVVADPALAAKVNGATIRPTPPRRMLALPMVPEAYGVLPRSGLIAGLFFLRATDGNGAFLARKEGGNVRFIYRLVASTKVPKDPMALPPVADLGAALGETARDFFLRHGSN